MAPKIDRPAAHERVDSAGEPSGTDAAFAHDPVPTSPAQSNDTRRRKVAIFEPYIFDNVYGNTRYIATIFKFIDRRQVDLVLISPVEGRFLKEIDAHGGEWRIMPAPGPLNRYGGSILADGIVAKVATLAAHFWYTLRLAVAFFRDGVDIVQCHDIRAILTAGLAAKIAGCRLIWYVKGELENSLLDRISFRLADQILFRKREIGVDIVQCHDIRAILTAGLAAKIAGCRLIHGTSRVQLENSSCWIESVFALPTSGRSEPET